jgi:hypothetical protein
VAVVLVTVTFKTTAVALAGTPPLVAPDGLVPATANNKKKIKKVLASVQLALERFFGAIVHDSLRRCR